MSVPRVRDRIDRTDRMERADRVEREEHLIAPATVHRPKRNLLRRHWLTGASIFVALGMAVMTGNQLYQGQVRLEHIRAERAAWDQKVKDAENQKKILEQRVNHINSDEYMEYMAKSMGFVYPQENVYQTGSPKSR